MEKLKMKVKVKDLCTGDLLLPTKRVVVRADYDGRVVLADGYTRKWNPNTVVTVER